jgi:hypothetical protein
MSSSPQSDKAESSATVIAMDGCNDDLTDSHEMTIIAAAPTGGVHVTTLPKTASEFSPLAMATSTPAVTTTSYVGGLFRRRETGGGGCNSATLIPTIAEPPFTDTLPPSTTANAALSSSTAMILAEPPELNIVRITDVDQEIIVNRSRKIIQVGLQMCIFNVVLPFGSPLCYCPERDVYSHD